MAGHETEQFFTPMHRLTAFGGFEGNVDDGFHIDGFTIVRCGLKLPLCESLNRVRIQLLIDPTDFLDTVDCSVAADYAVENHFSFNMLKCEFLRIFGIDLVDRDGRGDIRGAMSSTSEMQF